MCGRYTLHHDSETLSDYFGLAFERLEPRFNLAPTQLVPFIFQNKDEARQLGKARWGLVPHWRKDCSTNTPLFNARSETVLEKPAFKSTFIRGRCLVPASGWYEWLREGDKKQPHYLKLKTDEPIAFAGLFDVWRSQDEKERVVSVDFAKHDTYLQSLEHTTRDLVIVDEAHKLSATRYGYDVKKSMRYRLGEVLAQTSTQLLFLTATPHQGDDKKFRLLLDLLEPDLFATRAILEEAVQEGENPIMLRRLKEDMTDFDGKPLFPPRYVHTPEFRLTPSERELYERVTDYVTKHFKRAWTEGKRNIGLTMTVLQRRLAFSTYGQ